MANGAISGPPAVDFYSMLSGLGDTIQKNAADSARKNAYATALTPDPVTGKVDFGNAIMGLAQVDPHAAAVLQSVQSHQDSQAQADRTYNHQIGRDKIEDDWADTTRADSLRAHADSVALQKQTADRLANPVPAGYRRNPDGSLAFQTGGPEDPATVEAQAAAKAKADRSNPSFSTTPIYGTDTDPNSPTYGKPVIMQAGKDGSLARSKLPDGVSLPSGSSDESLTTRATRYLDTGDESLVNRRSFGAGQQGQQAFDALQTRIDDLRKARGMRPDEISSNKVDYKALTAGASASARTKAVRETNLDLILRAADGAIPAALEANAALPRSDFVPLNRLVQKGEVMTSDPRLLKFGMSNLQLAEHWARAMNPTGVMRESDRDKALHFLDTAYGNNTYEQGVGQLRTQIERERNAVKGIDSDHTRINGGRPVKVNSPDDAGMYPSGTKIILPDGSPGVVP